MNSEEFEKLLAEALSAPADKTLLPAPPRNLTPVKPLPRDSWLIAFSAISFAVFSVLAATLYGLKGVARMTLLQAILYCGVMAFVGLLLSMAAVQIAIPGAKVRVPRGPTVWASVLIVALTVTILFPNFGLSHFVGQGIPCLRLACLVAASFALLAGIPLRKGYITDYRAASLLIGSFAGFSGVAVLCLRCPLQNAAHIIVWHLGAVAISALGGLAIGSILSRNAL